MLVLSRKRKESVVVVRQGTCDALCTVTVLEIRGKTVRLGFEADSEVPVHRREVSSQIQADRRPQCQSEGRSPPAVRGRHDH